MPVKRQTKDDNVVKKVARSRKTDDDTALIRDGTEPDFEPNEVIEERVEQSMATEPPAADGQADGAFSEKQSVTDAFKPVSTPASTFPTAEAGRAAGMGNSNGYGNAGTSGYSSHAGGNRFGYQRPMNQNSMGMGQNNRRPQQNNMGMRRNMRPMNGQRPVDSTANGGNGYGSYSNYSQNVDPANYTGDVIAIKGLLEILPDYGVIRQENHPYDNIELPKDVYISQSQIRRFSIRPGDLVTGFARPPKEGERYLSLLKVDKVEGLDPEEARKRPQFSKLTPVFPNKWLKLETAQDVISTRLIDLIAPIGKGQRAILVAPPKAGKTWLLKDVANGITTNFPDVVLLVALIGERPEEVTHFSRSVKGEVFASNFDEKADEQTRIAEICLERAKRMAEKGRDVVILMDSLTRLARAYNMVAPPSGRTLTGGFDPAALYPAKHFFGAARNFEEGGSLTIIATALVETGSRMDDVIFEEFKGTGNMELRLDRALAERRIYPAIDIKASGTRHDEYLLDKGELEKVFRLRRMVDLLDDRDATELVIDRLKKSKTNNEFLENLHKGQ